MQNIIKNTGANKQTQGNYCRMYCDYYIGYPACNALT